MRDRVCVCVCVYGWGAIFGGWGELSHARLPIKYYLEFFDCCAASLLHLSFALEYFSSVPHFGTRACARRSANNTSGIPRAALMGHLGRYHAC